MEISQVKYETTVLKEWISTCIVKHSVFIIKPKFQGVFSFPLSKLPHIEKRNNVRTLDWKIIVMI